MVGPVQLTKLCQREHDEEQEQEHTKRQKDPHRLQFGAWEEEKEGSSGASEIVKRIGEKAELSTIERGSTNLSEKDREVVLEHKKYLRAQCELALKSLEIDFNLY
jgi:hypothetical protein